MTEYKLSEFAEAIPGMLAEEYQELVADIKRTGLLQDIVLYQGEILDGRHRYRACLEAGMRPRFTDYTGDDPAGYVISANLRRRHLDTSQKAMAVARMKALVERLKDEGEKNQKKGLKRGQEAPLGSDDPNGSKKKDDYSTRTASKLANLAGVGSATVKRAQVVLRDGTAEDVAQVERGEVSVSAKAEEVKGRKAGRRPTGNGRAEKKETVAADGEVDTAVTRLLQWAAEQPPVTAAEAAAYLGVMPHHAERYLRTLADSRGYEVRRAGQDKTYLITRVLKVLALTAADEEGGDAPAGFVPISPKAARSYYRQNIKKDMEELLKFKHCDRATFRPGHVYAYAEIIDRKIKELFKLISGVEVGG